MDREIQHMKGIRPHTRSSETKMTLLLENKKEGGRGRGEMWMNQRRGKKEEKEMGEEVRERKGGRKEVSGEGRGGRGGRCSK